MKGFYTAIFLFLGICVFGQISEKIKVNQLGYIPGDVKLAYLSDEAPLNVSSWQVRSAVSDSIFISSTNFENELYDEASADYVYTLDFTDLTEPGKYYVEVIGIGNSYDFLIADTAMCI